MWTSHVDFDSFIFLCVYFDLSKKRWSSPLDVIPFFALQAVQRKHSLLPTHHTGHHPVIWHRDVPPQECCISDIPSALPKDRFPASTFDSYLQSASFGDNILRKPAILLSAAAHVNKITVNHYPQWYQWHPAGGPSPRTPRWTTCHLLLTHFTLLQTNIEYISLFIR